MCRISTDNQWQLDRREARKILSDLRFLMGYIKGRVRAANAWNPTHNLGTVNAIYNAMAHELVVIEDDPRHERRHPHLKWQNMVSQVAEYGALECSCENSTEPRYS